MYLLWELNQYLLRGMSTEAKKNNSLQRAFHVSMHETINLNTLLGRTKQRERVIRHDHPSDHRLPFTTPETPSRPCENFTR